MAKKKKNVTSRKEKPAKRPKRKTTKKDQPQHLIVMTTPGVNAQLAGESPMTAAGSPMQSVLSKFNAVLSPVFQTNSEPFGAAKEAASVPNDDFSLNDFQFISAPENTLKKLSADLMKLKEVHAAYLKPQGEAPVASPINDMLPSAAAAPSTTPNYVSRQGYLDPAPAGIDARYAWQFPGGRGEGIRIIDCEWGWRFTHEDLQQNQGGVVVGTASADTNHGTAVLGEYSGDINGYGIEGICPNAEASAASFATLPSSTVIQRAADRLQAGDILLLEIHRRGPDGSGFGQDGYIAIEWWPDDFAAIRYAVNKGIIVVEAAGNGARNLDAPIFETPLAGFPSTWRNPFNPANPSSGAIVVGAGAPPPGTHGSNWGPGRSRLDFSNYGARVDAQGWGREVTTTGYGDLQGGTNEDFWYTDQFSGTSSASPIVVGALGCVQGILKAGNRSLLTPQSAKQMLRSTGTPQQDGPNGPRAQRIGNQPNLREMIALAMPSYASPGQTVTVDSDAASGLVIHVHGGTVNLNIQGEKG